MTNSSQTVTASLTLSAFGQTVASSGSSTSAYQFGATSGYRSEGDAGLTLVGCRFYDAQVGRFITRDTYLDQAPYAYCDGDPVNGVDPTGHLNWTRIGINILLIGCVFVACALIPEAAPLWIQIGAGVIIGGTFGAVGGASEYNQAHPDPTAWNNGDLQDSIAEGAITGAVTGIYSGPKLAGKLIKAVESVE